LTGPQPSGAEDDSYIIVFEQLSDQLPRGGIDDDSAGCADI
jgi:hypothetical protein